MAAPSQQAFHFSTELYFVRIWSQKSQTFVLTEKKKDVAIRWEAMTLLLFFCGFPCTVAQITASCITKCGQKCKELRGERGDEKKRGKQNRHKNRLKLDLDIIFVFMYIYIYIFILYIHFLTSIYSTQKQSTVQPIMLSLAFKFPHTYKLKIFPF